MFFKAFRRSKKKELHTIAFYNLENLFDSKNDRNTLDDDFTPSGRKKWSKKRYRRKLFKLAKTISKLGSESTLAFPTLVGIAEVESETAIKDLIGSDPLKKIPYGYVHYDSPDERGIDTGLLYHKEYFQVISSEPISLFVHNERGVRDNTRDILYVHGKLNNEEVHLFVNHWPSRRSGDVETAYKRRGSGRGQLYNYG